MRKFQFENGGYYHIYNRGVDKRTIFGSRKDTQRFLQSMQEFNTIDPIGSLHTNQFRKKQEQLRGSTSKSEALVNFVCYCLNPNHIHFVLEQVGDKGVEKFMQRLSGGYTMYFNKAYQRSGALFQGRYKARHIDSDRYLLHVSAYVNLNDKVHNIRSELVRSSWQEYGENGRGFCKKDAVLNQFKNSASYEQFAERALRDIVERKRLYRELEQYILD